MNLVAAVGIARVFRKMRSGEFDEAELEHHLHNRGFLARLLGRVTRRVSRPWHLYPAGLLMGLGFATATQVGLLVLAAGPRSEERRAGKECRSRCSPSP